jgi:hypothetical protein
VSEVKVSKVDCGSYSDLARQHSSEIRIESRHLLDFDIRIPKFAADE